MARLASGLYLGFLFFFSLPTFAQNPVTVAGNVYYGSDYNPAKNVTVSLYDEQHLFIESQSTADDGLFRFGSLRRSIYQISIDVSGYEPVSISVDISMGSDKGLAIYLKPVARQGNSDSASRTVSVHELSMPPKARDFMDSGMKKLYQDKNAQAALPDFQQAVSLALTYYEAEYQLAMTQLSLGNRSEAEASFRKALQLSENKYAEAHVGLGAVLLDTGNVADAEKSIRQGLQLNSNLWLGHYELGRALMLQKRFPDALTSAEQARLLAPGVPIVYRLLSNIHLAQSDYPALLADLETYISLDPGSPAGLRAKQLRDQLQQKLAPQQHLAPIAP
jgi:tetratricopeptide (TPR) repeat protein